MLSIPRDLAVEIPGHGRMKIIEAYSLGGLDLTARTVKALLSARPAVRINHAVATTFGGFTDVVDHLGSVHIDVDRRYYHTNAGLPVSEHWAEIDLRAGYQRLCGEEALAYVRFRHLDNDIMRAARHQGFLREFKDQLRQRGVLDNLRDRWCGPRPRRPRPTVTSRAPHGLLRLAQRGRSMTRRCARSSSRCASRGRRSERPASAPTSPRRARGYAPRCRSSSPVRAALSARRATQRRARLVPALDRGEALVRDPHSSAPRMPLLVPALPDGQGAVPRQHDSRTTRGAEPIGGGMPPTGSSSRRTPPKASSTASGHDLEAPTSDPRGRARDPPHAAASTSCTATAGARGAVAWRTPRAVYWVSNTLGLSLTAEGDARHRPLATFVRAQKSLVSSGACADSCGGGDAVPTSCGSSTAGVMMLPAGVRWRQLLCDDSLKGAGNLCDRSSPQRGAECYQQTSTISVVTPRPDT